MTDCAAPSAGQNKVSQPQVNTSHRPVLHQTQSDPITTLSAFYKSKFKNQDSSKLYLIYIQLNIQQMFLYQKFASPLIE